jgi:hypothetical protein
MKTSQGLGILVSLSLIAGALVGCASGLSADCNSAMTLAEYESVQDDAALLSTLTACPTAAEWIAALQAHPKAGIKTQYSYADAAQSLDWTCVRAIEAPACIDASKQGILTFDLDDPLLDDLQE